VENEETEGGREVVIDSVAGEGEELRELSELPLPPKPPGSRGVVDGIPVTLPAGGVGVRANDFVPGAAGEAVPLAPSHETVEQLVFVAPGDMVN